MKALSLREPWCWMMLHGKDVENRKPQSAVWRVKWRGDFLLQSSKARGPTAERIYYDDARRWLESQGIELDLPPINELPRGVICGVSELYDVIPPCDDWFGKPAVCARKWHMHDQYGLLVRNTRPTREVPCGGALFWFEPPADVVSAAMSR